MFARKQLTQRNAFFSKIDEQPAAKHTTFSGLKNEEK